MFVACQGSPKIVSGLLTTFACLEIECKANADLHRATIASFR